MRLTTAKSSFINAFVQICFIGFYASALISFLVGVLPWFNQWPLIGYPILFLPRTWVFLWLIPILFLKPSAFLQQIKLFIVSLFFIVFYHINYQVPFSKWFNASVDADIRLMSANLGGIKKGNYKLKKQIEYSNLDLVAFQESSKSLSLSLIPENWYLVCVKGNCISSKYSIELLNSQSRRILGGWGNIAALFKVKVKNNYIYFLNVHLETPRKGIENFQLSKLNFNAIYENAEQRYIESGIISEWVKDKAPLIIMGDFNMPIESAIYRQYFSGYNNAFNDAGLGLGYTKYTRLSGIRIDHILTDQNFITVNSWVEDEFGGDHRAILADIHLKNF